MDLLQRSEFRIRMAKYVTPEVKEGFSSQEDSNLMFDVIDMETALLL